jgi:hypothetical protein
LRPFAELRAHAGYSTALTDSQNIGVHRDR